MTRIRSDATSHSVRSDAHLTPQVRRMVNLARGDGPQLSSHRPVRPLTQTQHAAGPGTAPDFHGILRDNPNMPGAALYRQMKQAYKLAHGAKMPEAMKHALRPTSGSAIDGASVSRMEQAERGVSEFHLHAKTPERNALINEKSYVLDSKRVLSSGQHNTVYQCQFRRKQVDGIRGDAQSQVVKTSGRLVLSKGPLKGQPAPMLRLSGIDHEHPRVPDRNMATAIVDEALGTASAPKCSTGIFEGKVCLAMDHVPGIEAKEYFLKKPTAVQDPDLLRQMNGIEVNAYLDGNPDPNPTNILIHEDDGGRLTAKMIDNDMSFGPAMTNPDVPPGLDDEDVLYNHTGLPAFVDARIYDAVRGMDIDSLAARLDKHLLPEEISAFRLRAVKLKSHVEFLAANDRVISDWSAWKTPDGKTGQGGDFFTGTMEMAPVQVTNGSRLAVTPRSLICRQMMGRQTTYAFQDLPEMAKLKYADQPLVPPSGNDPLAGRDRSSFNPKLRRPAAPQPAQEGGVPLEASLPDTGPSAEENGEIARNVEALDEPAVDVRARAVSERPESVGVARTPAF